MSLRVQQDVSLKPFNTLGVEVKARWFAEARNDAEVLEALAEAQRLRVPLQVIGGGSNLLLTRDLEALVLRMLSKGVRVLGEQDGRLLIEAEAGELWHPFVLWTLEQGLQGLENLSLIPGTVGAAPMQNVGAYGVEIKDRFAGLTALNRKTGKLQEFQLDDCQFDYRDSLFKRDPDRWLILRVRFALERAAELQLDYGPVRQRLTEMGITNPSAADVSSAICSIRREKLPDPAQLGNAGSFFKNPLVTPKLADQLRQQYPDLVAYPAAGGQVKLAAGWLIEKAGWKGFREGDAGVHRFQALVLVNYGEASGQEILTLARRIQADILARFSVALEMEPNLL